MSEASCKGPGKRSKNAGTCSSKKGKSLLENLTMANHVTQATERLHNFIRKSLHLPCSSALDDMAIKASHDPFLCCSLTDFITMDKSDVEDNFITRLLYELADLDFHEKNNDLYQFRQSDDLFKMDTSSMPHLHALKSFVAHDVRAWLQHVSGITLNNVIDMFCAQYGHSDHLLCHDDQLENRKIAYILYLVSPDWSEQDGGSLDLFECNANGQPVRMVTRILPSQNMFAFFPVSAKSFHQVAEVVSEDKIRISITGWFHGDEVSDRVVQVALPAPNVCSPASSAISIEEQEFYSWINPLYLQAENQADIQSRFVAESEISLQNFLNPDKYLQVAAALASKAAPWHEATVPFHHGHFDVLTLPDVPGSGSADIITKCLAFLRSDAFFLVLSNLTGLKLHPLAEAISDGDDSEEDEKADDASTSNGAGTPDAAGNPRCWIEARRWRAGYYSLLHDYDHHNGQFCLEGRLFFNCGSGQVWPVQSGGYTSYISRDEDEELLSVLPEENTLALVYKDKETMSFVKYVNNTVRSRLDPAEFHDFSLMYYE